MHDVPTFWEYVDTCRVGYGEQSHGPFIRRCRVPWYRRESAQRPTIETWADLQRYVCETLNEPELRPAASRAWANYLFHYAPFMAGIGYRDLWRLRRQLREAQEAQLKAEDEAAAHRATLERVHRALAMSPGVDAPSGEISDA